MSCTRPGKLAAVVVATSLALTLCSRRAVAQEPDGAALYKQHCQSCHGAKGIPSKPMASMFKELKPLDSAFVARLSMDSIVAGLRHGVGRMKPYTGKLSDAEMLAVAKFVKALPTLEAKP